jgi:hypothetical protein
VRTHSRQSVRDPTTRRPFTQLMSSGQYRDATHGMSVHSPSAADPDGRSARHLRPRANAAAAHDRSCGMFVAVIGGPSVGAPCRRPISSCTGSSPAQAKVWAVPRGTQAKSPGSAGLRASSSWNSSRPETTKKPSSTPSCRCRTGPEDQAGSTNSQMLMAPPESSAQLGHAPPSQMGTPGGQVSARPLRIVLSAHRHDGAFTIRGMSGRSQRTLSSARAAVGVAFRCSLHGHESCRRKPQPRSRRDGHLADSAWAPP